MKTTPTRFQELKNEAFEAGENDTITEDYLLEGAQLWLDLPDELTDEQRDELTNVYRKGFMSPGTAIIDAIRELLTFAQDQSGDVFDGEEWKEAEEAIGEACKVVTSYLTTD